MKERGKKTKAVAHKRMNRRIVDAASKGVAPVLDLVWQELPCMNGVNLATALHRIARQCTDGELAPDATASSDVVHEVISHPAFNALLHAVETQATAARIQVANDPDGAEETMPAQCASILAWSLASLGICHLTLLEALADVAIPGVDQFQPYEVTNMLWAYAKLGASSRCPDLIAALARRLRRRSWEEFKAHSLSLAMWSFATANWHDVELLENIGLELSTRMMDLKPESISNICWAFAEKHVAHPALFEAVAIAAVKGKALVHVKPGDLTIILRAYAMCASTGTPVLPGFFAKIGWASVELAQHMLPCHLTHVMRSFAMANSEECLGVVSQLLDVFASNFAHFTPEELGSLARSAMKLRVGSKVFYDALAVSSLQRLADFDMRDLATMLQAFSQAEGLALATMVLEEAVMARRRRECIAASSLAANANKGALLLKELQESTGPGQQPLQSSNSPTASTASSLAAHAQGGKHEQGSEQSGGCTVPHSPGHPASFCPLSEAVAYAQINDAPMGAAQWQVPEPFYGELRPPPGLESFNSTRSLFSASTCAWLV
eukprot:TRINITY_DN17468_c0_g1_i1.p1 TRINITY_DN17468_c0_g1~~TRINITY_DN17468_c0_g1_i1.p1  ORF type:complete len:593 (+),score=110.24 TRINITY_DN17468_c0_g1_i1:125-1780(+)